jgi:FkbM family methyltransferase
MDKPARVSVLYRLLNRIRATVPPDFPLRRAWRSARIWYTYRNAVGPAIVRAFARAYPAARFVQVGANDGEQQDPLNRMIRRCAWRGVLVEPIPYVFERLAKNCASNPRLKLENVALADRDGTLTLYHLRRVEDPRAERLPVWYDALGSFSKDVVLKHKSYIPDIESRIVRSEVPCVTFDTLYHRYGIERLDLLHTDTEGYDYELLRHAALERVRPKLVIYEHHHLSEGDRSACRTLLENLGYVCLEEGLDTWCFNARDAGPQDRDLARHWSDRP